MSDETDIITEETEDTRDLTEAKKTLLKQAEALGLAVDGRWSVDTLAEKVRKAQDEAANKETETIKETSDTWVYLLKDAFPTAGEKCLKGKTICVPSDMAERWYEAGVARPGKEPV